MKDVDRIVLAINRYLDKDLPEHLEIAPHLVEAMRYVTLNGGKRLRPALLCATATTFDAPLNTALAPAAAIEYVHTYSLVHDALPAMQDDNLRRGNPTCHIACEGGAGRVTRTEMKNSQLTVLADTYNNFPFAAPNDLCQDRQGRIYFTSRPGTEDPSVGNVNAVYRIDPDGKVTQLLRWPEIHMPNGIVISPDNKTLYLIEAHPDADHHRDIRAYDLAEDGSLSNERILINFYPGRSGDGMCIDAEGNLWITELSRNAKCS